jgi:hypothetical protein
MSFESALAHYSKAYEERTTRPQDLSKAAPAEPRAQDAAHFFGLEKSAGVATEADKAWRESVLTLLADAIALGRELDRTNFYRDPQVGLTLGVVRPELRNDSVENNAFVAELLAIALENAKEIVGASDFDNKRAETLLPDARRALAEPKWSTEYQQKAAVIGALVKRIQDTPVENPLAQMSVAKGKSLAREVWKTVEPRAAFWDIAKSGSETRTGVQKFAGKSGDQILRETRELTAKIERECNEKLAKIACGKSDPEAVQQIRSARPVGELVKAAGALAEELAKFKDSHNQRIRDLRK